MNSKKTISKKRYMNKTFLTTVALMLAIVSAYAQRPLTIVHVNDTHSHVEPDRSGRNKDLGGVIERAVMIDSIRKADGKRNVLFLHAGDFSQGTSYFPVMHGNIEIDIINAMRYDCVTIGNHELDNGLDELGRRLKMLKCPVVCANYDFGSEAPSRYIKPYAIVRKAGRKIGIVGMLCDVSSVVESKIAAKLRHIDDAEVLNHWAKHLKTNEHCDLVICLSHLGFDADMRLAPLVRNVDMYVGGHSHTFLEDIEYATDLDQRQIPIVQSGCFGITVGEIQIDY